MATFCTKCGASVPAESQFCTTCGAPVAAAPASAPPAYTPVPPPAAPYAQMPAAYPPPPPPPGNSAVKIILIIVGVIVALGILAVCIFGFFVWRVSKAVHVEGHGDSVTLHTPGGSISTNSSDKFTASDLGVDIYPGASSEHGGARLDLPNMSMVTGVYSTPDSKDQVLSFYKGKIGADAATYDSGNGAMMTMKKSDQESVMITVSADQGDSKTKISIVHTKKK